MTEKKRDGPGKEPRISIIASAGSDGYPYYIGGCTKFYEAYIDGVLPKPYHMAGTSSGGLALASINPWNEGNIKKALDVTPNLKPGDIYGYSSFLKSRLGGILGLKITNHFLRELAGVILKDPQRKKAGYFLKGAEVGLDVALTSFFVYEIIRVPSLFSNKPLYNLLSKNLDFNGIFQSEIKLDVVAADRKTAERVVFTNYRPEDKNKERFLSGLMASAALPGLFPFMEIDGRELVDGGVLSSIPIREAIHADPPPDVIVILLYKNLDENGKDGPNGSAIENTHNCWFITTHEAARRSVKGYIKVNQNLETLDKLSEFARRSIKTAEESEEFRSIISQFSFFNKKRIPIILVQPDEEVPDMTFAEFNKEGLIKSMEIGYRAMSKAIPVIRETLNL